MELKNYYQILDITYKASIQEVKSAYKKQAKMWHPDMNRNMDTTSRMVYVNEAYYILCDFDKRAIYDRAYSIYFEDVSVSTQCTRSEKIVDDDLKDIINDAHFKAEEFVRQFIAELKKTSNDAIKGFWSEAMPMLAVGVIMGLLLLMMSGC